MAAKKNLVIVESPAKAKTIGKYLGPDYVVKASMGHLRDLPKSTLGVDVEGDFTPNYRPIKGKEDIIKDLKTTADKSKTVYLATDPDREGEAISWHLQHLLELPDSKAQRVTFNEITKKVVQDSIQHPRAIDQDLVDAQQARRVLDRIVGYQLSPLLWKKIRRGLSAGRVQSPALRLIVEREQEIEACQQEEYWTVEADARAEGGELLARLIARRSLRPNHLWQDLGLFARGELSELLHRHFRPLAERNVNDMKWKKFFYRELCRLDGLLLCKAPTCDACDDFGLCFGGEPGEPLLALARGRKTAEFMSRPVANPTTPA